LLDAGVPWTGRYGDVLRLPGLTRPVYYLGSPDAVREALVHQEGRLRKGVGYDTMRLLLGSGLITSDGELHRRRRRLVMPTLAPALVRARAGDVAETARRFTARWASGTVVDVASEMERMALCALGRVLFGRDVEDAMRPVTRAVTLGSTLFRWWCRLPGARWLVRLPFPKVTAFRRARRELDDALAALLEGERDDRDGGGGLLGPMLREVRAAAAADGDDDLLRDEVVTMLVAGHETTGVALTWTLDFLARHPEEERRVLDEVDDVLGGRPAGAGDLDRLVRCRWALAEAMRLRPPVHSMTRLATDDLVVLGHRIRRGSVLLVSQYALHRDPRFWDDPLLFRPDRWSEDGGGARRRDAYFPFGLASRRCVGEALFWVQAPILLATVAARWRLRARRGPPPALAPAVTLRPRGAVRMRLEARSPPSGRPGPVPRQNVGC
jgi:cytochrome P450